jgi:hypothetical protein
MLYPQVATVKTAVTTAVMTSELTIVETIVRLAVERTLKPQEVQVVAIDLPLDSAHLLVANIVVTVDAPAFL